MSARRWTAGDLRRSLDGVGDDMPIDVWTTDTNGGRLTDNYTAYWSGEVDQDGSPAFGITCQPYDQDETS